MKLSRKIMRVGAIASLFVAAGANYGDAGNVPVVTGFTLNFPGEDLYGPAGQLLNVSGSSPIATWQLSSGINASILSLGLLQPLCCTSSQPSCNFVVGETGSTVGAAGQANNNGISSLQSIQLPAPATAGQTIAYHITLQAHCAALSVGLRFTPVESDTSATALYRVTAN